MFVQRFKNAIMKVLGFACLAVLLEVSLATKPVGQMTISYYDDNNCINHEADLPVTWASDTIYGGENCYDYNYGASAKLTGCYETSGCYCRFYKQNHCQGPAFDIDDGNCLPDSQSYFSFGCYYCTSC
jgi:hypothetical protein